MERNNQMALNSEWIIKSIEYHGQPLQKMFEGEHGMQSLQNLGVHNLDFTLYQARQKQFVFQDRAKRLKIHSFIAKKANELFATDPAKECARSSDLSNVNSDIRTNATGMYADMPPLNVFLPENANRMNLVKRLYSKLKVGDIVYGKIQNLQPGGCLIRLLCTNPPNFQVFNDVKARAFLPHSLQTPASDSKGIIRNYLSNDLVCCEIVEVNDSSEKLVVGMRGQYFDRSKSDTTDIKLGLIQSNQLPDKYKFSSEVGGRSYESVLEESTGFDNPRCIEHLCDLIGLDSNTFYTNMSGLRGKYPNDEYSSELRQSQASSWAFRSVADGIEHFKEGRHAEAFQCLNKALTIDPRNVEGLVARGALYANNGSLKKAVEDFEYALKINPTHSNARKYMGETLVALGRNYEEENCPDEAKKAYQDCLAIIPHHEEAQKSLNFLWNKGSGSSKQIIDMNDLSLPALNIKMADQGRGDASSAISGSTNADARKESGSSKKGKKKKSKNRKRHSSSSSSSDSSDSSDSSSGDSSSSSESSSSSDSDRSKSKKKKKRSEKPRQRSISPLSRRMAMFSDGNLAEGGSHGNNSAYNYPSIFSAASSSDAPQMPNDYDLRVSKFLDATRDEDNYEEKVRKFVEEASKYKKERKTQESKKKDRKKSKKNKKDSKKKKKEKKSKSSKKDKDKDDVIDGNELREALKLITKLPLFDFNTKKLSDIEMNVEKSLNQLKEEEKKLAKADLKSEENEGKWKMTMFPKECKKEAPMSKYAFPNEDDDQDEALNIQKQSPYASSSSHPPPSYQNKYEPKQLQMPSHPPAGPSVLDKFGNFRRADQSDAEQKPPEPPSFRSRSHSRTHSSRSYSRSRSRSRSYSRRHRSRSYSPRRRSYSRSRSRSSSRNRRRIGGYQHNNRPRYFNNRGGGNRFNRGFGNRDFRNNRWNNNRNNGWNNRGRNNNRRNWRSRSRSYSRSRSPYDRRDSNPPQKPPSPPPQEPQQSSESVPAPN